MKVRLSVEALGALLMGVFVVGSVAGALARWTAMFAVGFMAGSVMVIVMLWLEAARDDDDDPDPGPPVTEQDPWRLEGGAVDRDQEAA